MPQTGVEIDVQTLARILEAQAEMMLRTGYYPTPGWKRMAKANRDLLKRLRELGDAGTYNAPNAGEVSAWMAERDAARQEHKDHLIQIADPDVTGPIDPADEEDP